MTVDTELFVRLIIPDTTAITAFHSLVDMGYKDLKGLIREDYYRFTLKDGTNINEFNDRISKVDILVNANKNRTSFSLGDSFESSENKKDFKVKILVKNIGDSKEESLLSTLKSRLGFSEIEKITKGTLWVLTINSKDKDMKKAIEISKKIAADLLYNKHYQKFEIILNLKKKKESERMNF